MQEHKAVLWVSSLSLCSDPLRLAPYSPARKSLKPPAPILLPYQTFHIQGYTQSGREQHSVCPALSAHHLWATEHLSAWQGCPLGSPWASSPCSELKTAALSASSSLEGSARRERHPSLSLRVGARVALWRRLGCSLHHWVWEKLLPHFPLISLAPVRDGRCFITRRV